MHLVLALVVLPVPFCNFGGFIGDNSGTINGFSFNSGTIANLTDSSLSNINLYNVGGVIGLNSKFGTAKNITVNNTVTVDGSNSVGGFNRYKSFWYELILHLTRLLSQARLMSAAWQEQILARSARVLLIQAQSQAQQMLAVSLASIRVRRLDL